jgi:diguanylate cyclase (GGDEF)-like protein
MQAPFDVRRWNTGQMTAPGGNGGGHAQALARTEEDLRHQMETRTAAKNGRELSAADRLRTTSQQLSTAARRDGVARIRDRNAAARDRTATARDRAASVRDRAAEAQERRALEVGDLDEAVTKLRELRISGASLRGEAAMERLAAAEDRAAAAADRKQAAADRRLSGMDELTGIFRRGRGELALNHEMDRSRRSGGSLVLALIDVDRLKVVNDSLGHAAGDALLRDVATSIVSTMRSYDVTVRWGGDEFVCALSDLTLAVACERMAEIQSALSDHAPGASISAGLAELAPDDSLESLIARADAALYRVKTHREP